MVPPDRCDAGVRPHHRRHLTRRQVRAASGHAGLVTEEPHVDRDVAVERLDLGGGAWVDVARGWMAGADELYQHLLAEVPWQTSQLFRYDHVVEERRLGAVVAVGHAAPAPGAGRGHPRAAAPLPGAVRRVRDDPVPRRRATARRSTATPTCAGSTTRHRHPQPRRAAAVAAPAPVGPPRRRRPARAPPTTSRRRRATCS